MKCYILYISSYDKIIGVIQKARKSEWNGFEFYFPDLFDCGTKHKQFQIICSSKTDIAKFIDNKIQKN